MTTLTIHIPSEQEIPAAAQTLAQAITQSGATVVAFDGEMGAGKTTIIRQLVKALGANEDEANSPSFSIINEYETPAGIIYHFDLYRLDSVAEAFDIGADEIIDSGELCLLEWPERIEPLLPPDTARVQIGIEPDRTRTLTFTPAAK